MSTDLMSYAAAAGRLGITERSVRNYVRRGFLQAKSISGSRGKFLSPSDVEELRLLREEQGTASPISRQEVLLLMAKLKKLEHTVGTILRLLDAKDLPLGITPAYAKELHAAGLAQLNRAGWSVEEIQPWSEVFLRVDEDDLKTISEAANDPRPWTVLLRVCAAMTEDVVGRPEYQTSLPLQDTHRTLAEGRRRLRAAAVIFEGQNTQPQAALRLLTSETPLSVIDVLDRVLSIKK